MIQVIIGDRVHALDYESKFADLTVCSSLLPFCETIHGYSVLYAEERVAKLGIIVTSAKESREIYLAIAKAYNAEVIEVSL
ncbi:MAG TPA: hypothetical protein PLE74_07505 [Candidatus Cloacimonadota bacterium]|nr:hypothetical protein [Candidatus Cloacimonadota bacterium]